VEVSRCLFVQSGLCESLWTEANNTAVYLLNRIQTWTGKKPCIRHVKVLGSIAVALDEGLRNVRKF